MIAVRIDFKLLNIATNHFQSQAIILDYYLDDLEFHINSCNKCDTSSLLKVPCQLK